MFDARAFIASLTQNGLILTTIGDRLTIAPASKLTDDMRALIRRHKPALLWQLRRMDQEVRP